MNSHGGPVRSRRTTGPVAAVTGASTPLGRAVLAQLRACEDVRRVVAIAAEPAADVDSDVTWRAVDARDPALVHALGDVDVVVHCALDTGLETDPKERRSHNVRGAQTVLTAAAAAHVRRVVLVTSAMVYGALPENAVPLPEDAPLRADADGTVVGDFLEIENLAARARTAHPGLKVTVVRPAALVGPGIDNMVTRHFEAPRLLVVRGAPSLWQFCHVDDAAAAVVLAALEAVYGVVTVGCEGWLEQADVELLCGLRRIELPAAVAFGTAERLHRLGILPAPVADLQYVVHPWVVPSTQLMAAGWRPTYDNATALQVLLEHVRGHHAVAARRLGRKDASLGAAGAAVAVVGTAALVRRARRRRRG